MDDNINKLGQKDDSEPVINFMSHTAKSKNSNPVETERWLNNHPHSNNPDTKSEENNSKNNNYASNKFLRSACFHEFILTATLKVNGKIE